MKKTIDDILKSFGTEFNEKREIELVRELNKNYDFPLLCPRDNERYFDKLLDYISIKRGNIQDERIFFELMVHAIQFRPNHEDRFSDDFYRKSLDVNVDLLTQQLNQLSRQRYTFVGSKNILTPEGFFFKASPHSHRNYTSLITLENLAATSDCDEHIGFRIIANQHEYCTGEVQFENNFRNYMFSNLKLYMPTEENELNDLPLTTQIKLFRVIKDFLKIPEFNNVKYNGGRIEAKDGKKSNGISYIPLNNTISSVLPFRFSIFSELDLNIGNYMSHLNSKLAKFREACKTIKEEPKFKVYYVREDKEARAEGRFYWRPVHEEGEDTHRCITKDTLELSNNIREGIRQGHKVLVTYTQGYQRRELDNLCSGAEKSPHFRRLRKTVDGTDEINMLFCGKTNSRRGFLYDNFLATREIPKYFKGNFKEFLTTDLGREYVGLCEELVNDFREEGMNEGDLNFMKHELGIGKMGMRVAKGIEYKNGDFSPGFWNKDGKVKVQLYVN